MELEVAARLRAFRRCLRSIFSAQSATNNPATTPATGTLTRARRIADRGRRSGQAQLLPVGETRRWTGRVDVGRAWHGCGMARERVGTPERIGRLSDLKSEVHTSEPQ